MDEEKSPNILGQTEEYRKLIKDSILCVAPEGKLLVKIYKDGRIEYGPDYTPDEAAKTFWEAMSRWAPKDSQ